MGNKKKSKKHIKEKTKLFNDEATKIDEFEESTGFCSFINSCPNLNLNKGIKLLKLERYDEAHLYFDSALSYEKTSQIYLWRGKTYFLQTKFNQAILDLDNCIQINPNEESAHYYKGLCLKGLNLLEKSINEFEIEISNYPFKADNYNQKALTLIMMGRYNEALTELDNAIERDPNIPNFYNNRATCLINLEKYDEALTESDNAIERDSTNYYALKTKAEILFRFNKPVEALGFINKILNDTNPEYNELKGLILYELKKEDQAIDCFIKSIDREEKPKKDILDKVNSIINNYKRRVSFSDLFLIKEDVEECNIFGDLNIILLIYLCIRSQDSHRDKKQRTNSS